MTHQPPQRCCEPASPCLDRRTLFALCGSAAASAMLPLSTAVAGPFETAEFEQLIPADKKFSREWLDSLFARGQPETFSGGDLKYIGMPIGGIGAGCLYLGGDGRLWLWGVFNHVAEGVGNKTATYKGQSIGPRDGALYVEPLDQLRPVNQGFELRIKSLGEEQSVPLDRNGFSDVSFTGEYPIATVAYRDDELPVTAELEAFSPFLPLNADDSSLPATVMSFTLKNVSDKLVKVTLAGSRMPSACSISIAIFRGRDAIESFPSRPTRCSNVVPRMLRGLKRSIRFPTSARWLWRCWANLPKRVAMPSAPSTSTAKTAIPPKASCRTNSSARSGEQSS